MANLFNRNPHLAPIIGTDCDHASVTATALALDSDLVVGASPAGDCFGIRFIAPPGNVHIDDVYFFITVGDADNTLTVYLAPEGASVSRADLTATMDSATGVTTSNSKWVKFTFDDADVLTPGTCYWIVIGDAAGATGSGLYQVKVRTNSYVSAIVGLYPHFKGYTSTAGFTSNGTVQDAALAALIKFSDGTVYGNPYTSYVTDTNNTLERGIKFSFTEQISCAGITFGPQAGAYTDINTFQIHVGADQPIAGTESLFAGFNGGAAYTVTADEKQYGMLWFPAVVTFAKDTVYRATFTYGNNENGPGYNQIEDAATLSTDGVTASYCQGNICRTIDNGAGNGWTDNDDNVNGIYLPLMALIISDQVAVAGGGTNLQIMVDGVWKVVAGAWVMVNGLWKQITS